MSCNCDSRLDSIMAFLEDLKAELSFVKTKCVRIEKEILGITNEAEVNPESLMETTTVRHLVEKLAFDVDFLNKEKRKEDEARQRQDEFKESRKIVVEADLAKATTRVLEELKLKYELLDLGTFQTEFGGFRQEFFAHMEKHLQGQGLASSDVQEILEATRAIDSDMVELHKTHFEIRNQDMERSIRAEFQNAMLAYAKRSLAGLRKSKALKTHLSKFFKSYNITAAAVGPLREELRQQFLLIHSSTELLLNIKSSFSSDLARHKILREFDWEKIKAVYQVRLKKGFKCDPKLLPLYLESLEEEFTTNLQGFTIMSSCTGSNPPVPKPYDIYWY